MKKISNGILEISVEEHGAELSSIRFNGREYLWGAYPEFWKRHSPVLFPIVGSVWNGKYTSHGETFQMGQHGLARDMDFLLIKEKADYLEYELKSSEETLGKYPYPFILRIGYKIEGKSITVIWKVENPTCKDMYFQIGAHPAFYWSFLSAETIENGVDAMNTELAKSDDRGYFYFPEKPTEIVRTLITEGGCVDIEKKQSLKVADGYLPLTTETFNHDALVLEHDQVHEVTLCDKDKKPYLTLSWDAPLVGLWSPPKKNAPFVCIEPWYGRADRANFNGSFEEKDWIQHLEGNGKFEVKYTITIN
jgi:galactose mutarotase-like enzyme